MKTLQVLFVIVVALSVAACGGGSSQIIKEDPTHQPISGGAQGEFGTQEGTGVEIIGATGSELRGIDLRGGQLSAEEWAKIDLEKQREMMAQGIQPVIYFELDKSIITEEAYIIIKHYADYLNDNLNESLTLVGHTDIRGTSSYNLALGERRAKSVKEVFMLYGVKMSRIGVISMGEELPAVDLQTEEAWAKNRRVEINIFE